MHAAFSTRTPAADRCLMFVHVKQIPAGVHGRCRATVTKASQVPAASTEKLVYEARELAQLSQQNASQQDIDRHTSKLAELSAAAGTNKVSIEINDGWFKAYTLLGRTAQRFRTVITLGILSFNSYKPTDLKIKITSTDAGGVYKGERDGLQHAYVIATPFDVVESSGDSDEGAKPTGIKGRSLAIGEYALADDNPQRLKITFKKMQLEPVVDSPTDMQCWLDTFAPHNLDMDFETGVLVVDLPASSPEGWMDYLLMLPEYQLVQGNMGSTTLLERV
eukprot:GHRR01004500.1.p1 GENE.GHRR01004500.1~~GHRR01004500.1.p1  ORF type:complete len:277 (+),score=78.93 GHRR01004500.1:133-963(+)